MQPAADIKWVGRSEGRKFGGNGMVDDIAEGLLDFGTGPFTISAARSEAIKLSIVNVSMYIFEIMEVDIVAIFDP